MNKIKSLGIRSKSAIAGLGSLVLVTSASAETSADITEYFGHATTGLTAATTLLAGLAGLYFGWRAIKVAGAWLARLRG